MKTYFLTVALAVLSMSFTLQEGIDQVMNALKSANTEAIGTMFDEFVDMKFLDKEEVKNLSKNQASITLKSFFSSYNIKGFEKVSDRKIGNTMYLAGKLLSGDKNQKGYNITVLLKQNGGKYQIISIRIS